MIYEFRCRGCGRRFEVHATLKEKEAGLAPVCPRCGGADVVRVFTPVLFLRRGGSESQAQDDPEAPGWEAPGEGEGSQPWDSGGESEEEGLGDTPWDEEGALGDLDEEGALGDSWDSEGPGGGEAALD